MAKQSKLHPGDLVTIREKDYLVLEYRKNTREEHWPSVKVDAVLLPKRRFGQLPSDICINQKNVHTFHFDDLSSTFPDAKEIAINTKEVKVFGHVKIKVDTEVIHHIDIGPEKNYDNIDRRSVPASVSKGTRVTKKAAPPSDSSDMSLD